MGKHVTEEFGRGQLWHLAEVVKLVKATNSASQVFTKS